METDYLFNLLNDNPLLLLIAVTALAVAIYAVISGSLARRKMAEQNNVVKYRVDSLWKDINAWQASQFSSPVTANHQDANAGERYATEKSAYDAIWPLVWSLHDKLGMFLRAVESDDNTGELRLEARNAALEARKVLNRVRPFCHADIDELVTQLIDNHIKAHLAACHLMDLRKDSLASSSSHEMAVQKEKFHMLYDGQAKEMLNQLVTLIRRRMLSQGTSAGG
ncbi:hypothetical protein [Marinobacter confluentis]|uniref:Uncharacterized protein n=1 Tax=Marinobacter confluentis TaxID=1697557 RepID=A0A4Z1BKB1_9GAMM|nr:hypothetical protein [Marinobacter confluentis]TGN40147.1 hypothetical protein E5Q11_07605 [Marinobacter confluentis]